MPILYDQFGREIPETKKPETRTMAVVSINDRNSEYPSDGLTPVRLAAIFKEADAGDVLRQAELFEEMEEKDAHLSAELLKRKNAINSVDFDIIPYAEGAKTSEFRGAKNVSQDKVCDACRDFIFGMPTFEDSLFDLLDSIGKGYAMSELHWDYSEGQAWISGLSWIHQKRITFNNSITPLLVTDQNLMGEEIPAWKTVYHRHKARSGYDTRAGLLRVCGWMYLFKNYAIKDWVRFMELFGIPMRIGKYQPGASKTDKDALISAVRSLGSAAAGVISKSTEIEFIEAMKSGGNQNPFLALANFCDAQMSKAILGGTLTSDAGDNGSRSLGEVHNEVRMDLKQSDGNSLDNAIRMQILRPFVGFNFGWDVPVPWFRHDLREPEDLKTTAERDKILAVDIGVDIDDQYWRDVYGLPKSEEAKTSTGQLYEYHFKYGAITKNEVRARLGLEPVEGGDELIQPITGPDGFQAGTIAALKNYQEFIKNYLRTGSLTAIDLIEAKTQAALKNKPGQEEDPTPINPLADKLGEEAGPAWAAILEHVRKLAEEAPDLETLRDNLLASYADLPTDALGEAMAQGFATAELAGRYDMDRESD